MGEAGVSDSFTFSVPLFSLDMRVSGWSHCNFLRQVLLISPTRPALFLQEMQGLYFWGEKNMREPLEGLEVKLQ